jgi:hypothetical protein
MHDLTSQSLLHRPDAPAAAPTYHGTATPNPQLLSPDAGKSWFLLQQLLSFQTVT